MLKNIKYSKNICRFLFIIFLFAYKNNASFMKSIEKSKKDFGALKDKASKVKDAANKKRDAVKGKFDEAKGKFDEAKGKFDEAKGKVVDEVKGKFDEAKGRVDEVKGKFDEAKGKIDEVKGKFDEAKGKVDEVKGKFDEAKGKFDEAFDEAKEKVSNFKKDENNSSNEKKNSDNISDNNYDNQNNADLYNNSNNSENNFQKEKMKDDERYFIISADVITENSDFFNFGISTVHPKQPFSKESFKKIVLKDRALLIFFIWMLFTLFLSICVIFYFHIKKNYKSFIIATLFSVCYSLIFLNSIFIVEQNHLYGNIIRTLVHNLILCCIFASLGGFIGIFVLQEIRSKKRLP